MKTKAKITSPKDNAKGCCSDLDIRVYILVTLFGMSSWIAITAIFVEQPLLVPTLPEGWKLPSYLVVTVQIGNISIFVATYLQRKFSSTREQIIVIYVMMSTTLIAILCLSFTWDYTADVAGQPHSVPLLLLVFVMSLTACSSGVIYLPFMTNFKSQYLSALFLGEGLGGLLPSLLALAQGAELNNCKNMTFHNTTTNITYLGTVVIHNSPNLGVTAYMLIISGIVALSFVSFSLLTSFYTSDEVQVSDRGLDERRGDTKLLNIVQNRKERHSECYNLNLTKVESKNNTNLQGNKVDMDGTGEIWKTNLEMQNSKESAENRSAEIINEGQGNGGLLKNLTMTGYVCYLLLNSWIYALEYSILFPLQTYSTLPYGRMTYHLVVVLTSMADPVACFLAGVVQVTSSLVLGALLAIGSMLSTYIVFLATLSPDPLSMGPNIGALLSVLSWVAVIFVFSFAKVCIAGIIRHEGKKALMWCCVTKEIGANPGAILMYVLINVLHVFKSSPSCPE